MKWIPSCSSLWQMKFKYHRGRTSFLLIMHLQGRAISHWSPWFRSLIYALCEGHSHTEQFPPPPHKWGSITRQKGIVRSAYRCKLLHFKSTGDLKNDSIWILSTQSFRFNEIPIQSTYTGLWYGSFHSNSQMARVGLQEINLEDWILNTIITLVNNAQGGCTVPPCPVDLGQIIRAHH